MTTADIIRRPFKDYLFMIVRHKRRLYQYESDNVSDALLASRLVCLLTTMAQAQHPKLVITVPYGNTVVRPVDYSLFSRHHVLQVISRYMCARAPTPFEADDTLNLAVLAHCALPAPMSRRTGSGLQSCRV